MSRLLAILLFGVLAAPLAAQAPSQFRGAGGRGISDAKGLPVFWSATENLRWKTPLPGRGLSNPVLGAGRVYVTACSGFDATRLHVLAFDQATGKQLWERTLRATGSTLSHPKTNMAAPTPICDGQYVYTLFATGDLVAYDRDGNLRWYRSLVGDYPTVGNNVGMAASPTLADDTLLVCLENVGESFLAGIDTKTGRNRWRADRPRGINWVTPLVTRTGNQAEVICQGPADLTAYAVATGQKQWSLTGHAFSTMASLSEGDGTLFVPGDKFLAVSPGTPSEKPRVLWQSSKLRPGYCSPLVAKGRVYTVTNAGIVTAADAATGKVAWTYRLEGSYAASPLLAEGLLYLVSEDGKATVLRDTGSDAETLGIGSTLKDTFLASPVAAGDALFLRSDVYLYCIGTPKD